MDLFNKPETHGIRHHHTGLSQHIHRRFQVRLKRGTDRKCNVAEARKNRDLHVPVQNLARQVLEEDTHERAGVLRRLLRERAGDVADHADRNGAQLRVFVRLERRVKVGEECGDVGREALFEC